MNFIALRISTLHGSFFMDTFAAKAIHNKDYSVVKTFKAVYSFTSPFFLNVS